MFAQSHQAYDAYCRHEEMCQGLSVPILEVQKYVDT